MPTTVWSSCGARRATCCRASWTSAGAAPSSRGQSGTSSSARAWPVWSSSTSGIRPSTSGASTGCRAAADGASGPALGESFHIGRLAVSGPDHEPLVVDWRAPVAEPFYRATGLDPQGLARRRHLAVRGRSVLGLEDEYFVDLDGRALTTRPRGPVAPRTGAASASSPTGWSWAARARCSRPSARPAPATWATSSARSSASRTRSSARRWPACWWSRAARGRQDCRGAAPRRVPALYPPLPAGTPGRARGGAEPAVPALHRQVLPSLGETGVSLSRWPAWCPRCASGGSTTPQWPSSRATCGWSRCCTAPCGPASVRSAATPRSRSAQESSTSRPDDRGHRRLGPAATRHPQHAAALRRGAGAALPGRGVPVPARPRRHRHGGRRADPGRAGRPGTEAAPGARGGRGARPDVASSSPHEFLHDLFGARPLLVAAGKGILAGTEVQRLYRPRSTALDAVHWTVADTALIDEARTLLGPRRGGRTNRVRAQRNGRHRPRTIGSGPRVWRRRRCR